MTPRLTFQVTWLGDEPTDIIGHDLIRRPDLTDAITACCNLLKQGRGQAADARGFHVVVLKAGQA
jgi:hypothetical protein